jgi:plasmid stabilization system protein ParE
MASSAEQPVVWAIRFTDRASDDIQAAEDYLVETAGDDIAKAWSRGLIVEVAKLARFPTIWPAAEEDKLFKQSVRRMLHRRTKRGPACRVLFVLRQSPDDAPTVGTIHVRHSARAPVTQQEAWKIEASE